MIAGSDVSREYEAALGLAWMGISPGSTLLRLAKEVGVEDLWHASARQLVAWGTAETAARVFVERRRQINLAEATLTMVRSGLRFLPVGSQWYPPELRHLESPPAGLFVRSSVEALSRLPEAPRITVVGTRKATPEGLWAAEAFVRAFAARGVTVVSGMAIGIDAQAHTSTLDTGGSTVAILGCGVDVIYPRRHRWLYERITQAGIIASELPPGSYPTKWTFPHRNRLLAAVGDAVLVIQGSNTSGALQTAKWALDLGKPVFCVPGSILRKDSEGCNTLIYEGAVPALKPETTVEDFLLQTRIERGKRRAPDRAIAATSKRQPLPSIIADGHRHRRVLEALGGGPASADDLVARTGLSVREIGAALGELEAAGRVIRGGPGVYLEAPRAP